MKSSRDVWPLAGLYMSYYAAEGVLSTYWPYWMGSLGMTPDEIGLVFGVRVAVGIVAQLLLTALSDWSGRPRRALKWVVGASFLALAWAPWAANFAGVALLLWVQTVPRSAIVPLTDAATLDTVGADRYGRLRLWGSVGYGASVAGFGVAFQALSYAEVGRLAVPAVLTALGLAALVSLLIPEGAPPSQRPSLMDVWRAARRPALLVFLCIHALHWATLGFNNIFLSVHVEALSLGPHISGLCVAAAILAEVVALYALGGAVTGASGRWWALAVPLVSAGRWAATAWSVEAGWLIAAQVAHMMSFGVWFMGLMAVVGRLAPPGQRAATQGVMMAVVFGLGGVLGSWLGGVAVSRFDTQTAYLWAAAVEGLSLVGMALWWRSADVDGVPAGLKAS